MTHRLDVAGRRDVVARWCNLAEQRLEYLTELFETGRWRRFHSEVAFLENIQEAKIAVETWRSLWAREASTASSAVNMSWLGHTQSALPRAARLHPQLDRRPSPSVKIAAEPMPPPDVSIAAETVHVAADQTPSAPETEATVLDDVAELTLDAIAQRYPLLRNAL